MRKQRFWRIITIVALICLLIVQSGCGLLVKTGKDVIKQYNGLIEAYQDARRAAADGNTCLSLTFSEMSNQTILVNNYLAADVAKTKAYREALAEYGGKFAQQQKAYQGTDANSLDLGELAKQGATPAQMALTVNAYVTTFQEAPLAQVDAAPVINAQRIVSEKYNMAFSCVKDWNDAVGRYNKERNKVPGDVVGTLAEYLKVKELPAELPYFTMTAPSQPPTVPTASFK